MRTSMWGLVLLVACDGGKINLDDETGDTDENGEVNDTSGDSGDSGDTDDSGLIEDTDIDTALADELLPARTLTGNLGSEVGAALDEGDINGDGADDLLVGAPGVNDGSSGTAFLLPGPFRGDVVVESAASATFFPVSSVDRLGVAVTHGDFNADGVFDVAIGALVSGTDGYVGVTYGPFGGSVMLSTAVLLDDGVPGNGFGGALAVGDLNGDGVDDLAVGGVSGSTGGNVEIYLGSASGISAYTGLVSENEVEQFGTALEMADLNGDGVDDLITGAPGADGMEASAGAVYAFFLDGGGVRLFGERADDRTGTTMDAADFDGDGYVDLAVGAPKSDKGGMTAGAVYVVRGPFDSDRNLSTADAVVVGYQPGGEVGDSLAYANDMDSDGYRDLVVGAPHYTEVSFDEGRAYMVYGPIDGWLSVGEADYVVGYAASGVLGSTVLGDTDLTGDSVPDVLIAAPLGGSMLLVNGY